jgi:hypothetical protein
VFIAPLKTLIVESLRAAFDDDHPVEQFRGVWASLEYPAEKTNYPGVWVDFAPTTSVQTAGIGHEEYVEVDDGYRLVHRWRYAGTVQMTAVALTSLERDLLVDELVKLVAFGREDPGRADFRDHLEHGGLIEFLGQWDRLAIAGKGETPGTPWGTDEVVYEQTVAMDVTGSFVSDGVAGTLVPLSAVVVYQAPVGQPPVDAAGQQPSGGGWV